ncbi:MAG: 16S rRNA (uracil(1498)-N(3))-methyltransferase [Burkholderiales bacterium]
MPISRFYCPVPLASGQMLDLPPQAAHHAARVLRLREGDRVVLFNGEGGECVAKIFSISKSAMTVEVLQVLDVERESPLRVTLAQAVSAGEKMDYTIQKAVELGVRHIQPLESERCVVRLSGERAEKRVQHWQQVVVSACEQSGRNRVPPVAPVLPLSRWLEQEATGSLKLMLSPEAEQKLSEVPCPAGEVVLLIGPEGGFSAPETAAAAKLGYLPVRLGARVLRTETAALAALAAMSALWGDF